MVLCETSNNTNEKRKSSIVQGTYLTEKELYKCMKTVVENIESDRIDTARGLCFEEGELQYEMAREHGHRLQVAGRKILKHPNYDIETKYTIIHDMSDIDFEEMLVYPELSETFCCVFEALSEESITQDRAETILYFVNMFETKLILEVLGEKDLDAYINDVNSKFVYLI